MLKCQNEGLDLKIRSQDLEVVETTKYLGLQIDSSLDWKEHVKSVSTKVSRAVGFLKYAKSFLPMEVELSQLVALMPQANHLFTSLDGRPLQNL